MNALVEPATKLESHGRVPDNKITDSSTNYFSETWPAALSSSLCRISRIKVAWNGTNFLQRRWSKNASFEMAGT